MSLVEEYRAIRQRLRNPPNAMRDHGIDLRRREKPKPEPIVKPAPVEVPAVAVTNANAEDFLDVTPLPPIDVPCAYPVESRRIPITVSRSDGTPVPRRIQVEDIIKATAKRYGMTRAELLQESRVQRIVRPRQVGMFIANKVAGRSLPDIGRRFGGRDHTTALNGVRRIEKLLLTDNELAADVDAITAQLRGEGA